MRCRHRSASVASSLWFRKARQLACNHLVQDLEQLEHPAGRVRHRVVRPVEDLLEGRSLGLDRVLRQLVAPRLRGTRQSAGGQTAAGVPMNIELDPSLQTHWTDVWIDV